MCYSEHSVSENRRADVIALSILALLPTLLFLDVLLGINSFYTGDLPTYYYPAKKILRENGLSLRLTLTRISCCHIWRGGLA